MEYLITNQNFCKSKLPLFHEFNFLKKHIYANKATLRIFDIFYLLSLNIELDQI